MVAAEEALYVSGTGAVAVVAFRVLEGFGEDGEEGGERLRVIRC
jgi:hypothetical protein